MCDSRVIEWSEGHVKSRQYVRMSEFTLIVLVGWVCIGVSMVVAAFSPTWSPSLVLASLPDWFELMLGLSIGVAGVLGLWGSLGTHSTANQRWGYEVSSMVLGCVGWLTFAASAVVLAPLQLIPVIFSSAFAVGAAWRAWRVWVVSAETRGVQQRLIKEDRA